MGIIQRVEAFRERYGTYPTFFEVDYTFYWFEEGFESETPWQKLSESEVAEIEEKFILMDDTENLISSLARIRCYKLCKNFNNGEHEVSE